MTYERHLIDYETIEKLRVERYELLKKRSAAKAPLKTIEKAEKRVIATLKVNAPASCKSQDARSDWAYAHDDYQVWLDGYGAALELFDEINDRINQIDFTFEEWRTQRADQRSEKNFT